MIRIILYITIFFLLRNVITIESYSDNKTDSNNDILIQFQESIKLNELLQEINELSNNGQNREAEIKAVEGLKVAREIYNDYDLRLVSWLINLAMIQHLNHKYKDSETLYLEAINTLKELQIQNINDPNTLLSYLHSISGLGLNYKNQGRYRESEEKLKEAITLIKNKSVSLGSRSFEIYSLLANIYILLEKYDEAEEVLKNDLIRDLPLPDHYKKIDLLASIYEKQVRFDEAIKLYNEILEYKTSYYGPQGLGLVRTFNKLAKIYKTQGLFIEAENHYNNSLEILNRIDKQNILFAETLSDLGSLYEEQQLFEKAEDKFKNAIRLAVSIYGSNNNRIIIYHNLLGNLYKKIGRYIDAEDIYNETLSIDETNTVTLVNFASLYRTLGNYNKSETLLREAIKIQQNRYGSEHPVIANTLSHIGLLYGDKAYFTEAEVIHKKALNILTKAYGNNHSNTIAVLNNLATLYVQQGNYLESQKMFQVILKLSEGKKSLNLFYNSIFLNNLCVLYTKLEKYNNAELVCNKTIELLEKINFTHHPQYATALTNKGEIYNLQNNYQEANIYFELALKIRKKYENENSIELANSYHNLSMVNYSQGYFRKAQQLIDNSIKIYEKNNDQRSVEFANVLSLKALINMALNNSIGANIYIERALETLSYNGKIDPYSFPLTPATLNILHNYLYINNQLAKSPFNNKHKYFSASKLVLNFLERYRYILKSDDIKIYHWSKRSDLFELALESTYISGVNNGDTPNEAYYFLESALSRNLSELLSNKYLLNVDKLNEDIQSQEQKFLNHRFLLSSELIIEEDVNNKDKINNNIIENEKKFNKFIDKLYEQNPNYAQLKYPRSIDLQFIQNKLLSNNQVSISYYVGNENTYALAVTNKDLFLIKIGSDYDYLIDKINELRSSIFWYKERNDPCVVSTKSINKIKNDFIEFKRVSRELYDILISPLEPYFINKEELIIIPHSILWNIPFETLMNQEGDYLAKNKIINYQNSYSVWSLNHKFLKQKTKNPKKFVGIGDAIYQRDERYSMTNMESYAFNVFSKLSNDYLDSNESQVGKEIAMRSQYIKNELKSCAWDPLDLSKEEIEDIKKLPTFYNVSDSRLGVEASEWNLDNLDLYEYVHFSVHGLMKIEIKDNKSEPALILTQINPKQSGVDGILTMGEVINKLKLNANLVTLSSCDTGLGEVVGGEGVMSMTRAFQISGSAAILASLWKIHEEASKVFMVRFYSYIDKGLNASNALFLTKNDFIKKNIISSKSLIDLSHPFFWGAFILVGAS